LKQIQSTLMLLIFLFCLNLSSLAFAQPEASADVYSQINQIFLYKKVWATLFVILIGYILIFALVSIINNRITDIKARHAIRKNSIYIVTLTTITIVFFIWIQNINSITIFLGVAGAGVVCRRLYCRLPAGC